MAKSSPQVPFIAENYAHLIVQKGGDYLLQIKGTQPKLFEQAKAHRFRRSMGIEESIRNSLFFHTTVARPDCLDLLTQGKTPPLRATFIVFLAVGI
jgi:hypothetical protein